MWFFLLFFVSLNIGAQSIDYGIQSADHPVQNEIAEIQQPSFIALPPASGFTMLTPEALSQPVTQRFITRYTSPSGIRFLEYTLERGGLYLPFIMEEVERRNLPYELIFLPIVESSFQSTAISRSGAAGLWQFMMNSIGGRGMLVNEFVDERKKFINATRGALQKLEDHFNNFGSWPMALAAYNSGPGAVGRMIQRTGINDYWELSRRGEFREETVNFVPRLLAISYVLSQPERFGINVRPEAVEWTTIPLENQVSLSVLAAESGADPELLKRLNAHLLLGITPPVKNYPLVVPLSHFDEITSALQRGGNELLRFHRHIIQYGDTLWALSRRFGVSLALIEQYNPGISSRFLRLGETVLIPVFNETLPQAAAASAAPPAARPAAQNIAFEGTHLVRSGETLWSLARAHGVSPQALAEANNMELNQILSVGRVLRVPVLNQ